MSSSPLCACREGELSAKTLIHQLTGGFKAVELGEFSREREQSTREGLAPAVSSHTGRPFEGREASKGVW